MKGFKERKGFNKEIKKTDDDAYRIKICFDKNELLFIDIIKKNEGDYYVYEWHLGSVEKRHCISLKCAVKMANDILEANKINDLTLAVEDFLPMEPASYNPAIYGKIN